MPHHNELYQNLPEELESSKGDRRNQTTHRAAAHLIARCFVTMAEGQRLEWLCRRGTRELDLLLLGYFKEVYPQASARHKSAFKRMLDLSDPELHALLIGDGANLDKETADIVESIRVHFSSYSK